MVTKSYTQNTIHIMKEGSERVLHRTPSVYVDTTFGVLKMTQLWGFILFFFLDDWRHILLWRDNNLIYEFR